MATYKEFFDFARNSNANMKKAGLYAIQPEPYKGEPPIKVGYSRNLVSRLGSYRNVYPQGIRVHMVGRVPARDQMHPSVNRDDVVEAEKRMLAVLTDKYMKRKEWFQPGSLQEIKKALTDAQKKFALTIPMQARLYDSKDIKRLSKVVKREIPEYEEQQPSTLQPLVPAPKRRRTGLSDEELLQGARGMTKKEEEAAEKQKKRRITKKEDDKQLKLDVYRERKHRSGEHYKGIEEPPPPKRMRIKGKQTVGTLVTDTVEPVSRLTKKTRPLASV